MYHLSVLDSRSKEWKARKGWWNISTPIGREDLRTFWGGVSVFDPVLAELFYGWYCPPKGSIIDPFAGGPQRHWVAKELGYSYTGIDVNPIQVQANQTFGLETILGDSEHVLKTLDQEYDLAFSCPPYHDLEVYTDAPEDLSTLDWETFVNKYTNILANTYEVLRDNRFMVLVVSEIRDCAKTRDYKIGKYKNFVGATIAAAERAGFHYYNDFIYIQPFESGAKQMNRMFKINRKVPRVHQNILVFVKGNPDIATIDIDGPSTFCCEVFGVKYRTFREAAICIGNDVVASDVKWRCGSPSYPTYKLFI